MVDLAERPDWAVKIAEGLGYQPTPWRVDFFTEWMRWENTTAENNPLATTWKSGLEEDDWTPFNHNGGNPVCNYASEAVGLKATVDTLTLSYYDEIRDVLSRQSFLSNQRPKVAQAVRTWGTIGFANRVSNGWSPGGAKTLQAAPPEVNAPVIGSPAQKQPVTARTVRKSARDAVAIGGGAAALSVIIGSITNDGFDWGPLVDAVTEGHWTTVFALAAPFVMRIVRALSGNEPQA